MSDTIDNKLFNSGTRTDYILNGSLILAEKISRKGEEDEVLNYYYTAEGKLVEMGKRRVMRRKPITPSSAMQWVMSLPFTPQRVYL